eukprot:TRINITY_DN1371_c0_g1_i4.p2 TRINITY_DN1371_c0_g1~~TRINITY_DN1371_c0_g1_i4.p2  ORF type:complete len:188 (+),score=48.65 TRINITY_DN1371_c0_g1_i4:28-564(+)
MEATSDRVQLDKAIEHKNLGNAAFQKQDWHVALTNYHYGLLAIRHLTLSAGKQDPMLGMVAGKGNTATDSDKKEAIELQNTILLNMGAVFLKQQKPQRAIDELTKVLALDPKSLKALYRRGQAYIDVKNYDKAKADYLKWKELSTTQDKLVEANLRRIALWEKQEEERSKKVYQNMFS